MEMIRVGAIRNSSIVLKERLNLKDYEDINNLQNLCLQRDNTVLKLELDYKLGRKDKEIYSLNEINEFMYYEDTRLIAYIGICDFSGDAIEVNGMVHPDYRQRRIFTRLFNLVKDEWQKRKPKKMLLLCDKKCVSGQGFINTLNTVQDHTEYEMVLNSNDRRFNLLNDISFIEATSKDSSQIRRQNSIYFGSEDEVDDNKDEELVDVINTYLAQIDNNIVGKVRLEVNNNVGGIYGLGVLPAYRTRGYGRDILTWSIKKLKEMDAKKIMLQVSVSNEKALHIYTSSGFEITSTMDYYEQL